MEKNYKAFEHTKCEYYPCHGEGQNCLFCYCPLYFADEQCKRLGNPKDLTLKEGKVIKDCSDCEFPHDMKNFELMMSALRDAIYGEYADNYGGGLPKEL